MRYNLFSDPQHQPYAVQGGQAPGAKVPLHHLLLEQQWRRGKQQLDQPQQHQRRQQQQHRQQQRRRQQLQFGHAGVPPHKRRSGSHQASHTTQ